MGDDDSTSKLELSEEVDLDDLEFQNLPGRPTHDEGMHSGQYHLKSISVTISRILRKEPDRVVVPEWEL